MSDILVTIRMPPSLLEKLKRLTIQEDFMDTSEAIRSIVRKQWLASLYPEVAEIRRLRSDIFSEVKKKASREVSKKVMSELQEIKKHIEKNED